MSAGGLSRLQDQAFNAHSVVVEHDLVAGYAGQRRALRPGRGRLQDFDRDITKSHFVRIHYPVCDGSFGKHGLAYRDRQVYCSAAHVLRLELSISQVYKDVIAGMSVIQGGVARLDQNIVDPDKFVFEFEVMMRLFAHGDGVIAYADGILAYRDGLPGRRKRKRE